METITYVYDNAEALGIDKSNLVVTGEGTGATTAYSGEFMLTVHTSYKLNRGSHIIKLAIEVATSHTDLCLLW